MTNESIHRTCCCCGFLLPENLSKEELLQKGAATIKGDGQWLFHCKHHTEEQINDSQMGFPRFYRASELDIKADRKYDKMINSIDDWEQDGYRRK